MAPTFRFNPGFQSDEESVQNFIVRKADFAHTLEPFRGGDSHRPRVLIVAPRGAGKTTLCRRVLAEVNRESALRAHWHPIFFGEESYAITTPGEFLLECLFHLQDRSDERAMKDAYKDALAQPSDKELTDVALKTLRAYSKRIEKRLLVIVENFQTILDDQIGTGAKELLKHLSDSGTFGVLATSVAQLMTEENVALPSDFLRIDLKPLSREECRELWNSLTQQEIKTERIRPLEILTGGSPRLLHILAEFMRSPSLHNLMENLNFLIDQNTEYFKSQLDRLPPTERKIFAALLEAWDPATAKKVSEAARVSVNTASKMLLRLAERGAVIKSAGTGRSALYSASERLFNIYYLMRRRSHPSGRVRALVSFMTDYYDRDELIDTATTLAREACSVRPDSRMDYHAFYDAILARVPTLVPILLERTPPDFLTSFTAHQKARAETARLQAELPAAEPRGHDNALDKVLNRAEQFLREGDTEQAIRLYLEAAELRPNAMAPRMRLIVLYLNEKRTDEAIKAAGEVIKLHPKNPWGHSIQGLAYMVADDTGAAETAFEAALKIDANYGLALGELAAIKDTKGQREAAIALYERARRLDRLTDGARAGYARILQAANQTKDAEDLLRDDVDEEDQIQSRRALVELLSDTDRQQEGIDLLRRAAERSQDWRLWADLGSFVLARDGNDEDAVGALEKSIALGAEDPMVFVSYAQALQRSGEPPQRLVAVAQDLIEKLHDDNDAWMHAVFLSSAGGDKAAAETYARTALELDENKAHSWLTLALLLRSLPKRNAEAEKAFRKAAELGQKDRFCSAVNMLAEFLIHRGEETAAQETMTEWFAGDMPCYCCAVLEGDIAARSGNLKNAIRAYRGALKLRGDGIQALTGLSRCVLREEGEELIARAMASDPSDPRCLLARARLRQDNLDSQIEDASEAIRLSPVYAEAHLFLTQALLRRNEVQRAQRHLELALKELPQQRELTSMFVDTAMAVAVAGGVDGVSSMLEKDEIGSSMEPLIVALKIERGDKPIVAKEVWEVALDIVNSARPSKSGVSKSAVSTIDAK